MPTGARILRDLGRIYSLAQLRAELDSRQKATGTGRMAAAFDLWLSHQKTN